MKKTTGLVTMHGQPLTLLGDMPEQGHAVADCQLTANDLSSVKLSDYFGQPTVISSVPSLDTPVCDAQTRKFNEMINQLSGAKVITVSMDLPFAQARWCGASGLDNVVTLSDHTTADFGLSFGVLINGSRLLARAIFVVDSKGILHYTQIVPELTHEPGYESVIDAVKRLL